MARKSATIRIARGTEILFFDMAEFEPPQNLALSVCQATKHPGNPLMVQGDMNEWDSGQASPWAIRTVMYDEDDGIFKCWYNGTDASPDCWWRAGYAVSRDGIVWKKPRLGVFEFEGNKQNNVISSFVWGCVLKDRTERDPAKRYKIQGTNWELYSPDGIRWTPRQRHEMKLPPDPRPWDPVAFVRDEQDPDPSRRYKFVWQSYLRATKPGPDEVRAKYIAFSPDGHRWRASRHNPFLSPNDGFEQENHFLMLIPYKGQYLVLYECGWYHPDGTGKFGRYCADIRLAHSRDCEHFARINPSQAVIPRGGWGDWDGQHLVITDKVVIKDNTIYLYYCGQGNDWTSWPAKNQVTGARFATEKEPTRGTGCMRLTRMGLATLRLDGFTCVRTHDGNSFGSLTTKPLSIPRGKRIGLTVNLADTQALRSWLQVELLDARPHQSFGARTRKPIEGFTREDCAPLVEDGLRVPVRWKGRSALQSRATAVRLRFHLYGNAKLHSFRFA